MTINTFRDLLMTTHFDTFRLLFDELNAIKEDLKNKQRRVSPPTGTFTAYRMIKKVTMPISRIFHSKRYGYQKCIDMFKAALVELDLLIREMTVFCLDSFAVTLRHIYQRLFNLLPKNTVVQNQLFDTEMYQTTYKKSPVTIGFISWLQDYHLKGLFRRDLARKRSYQPIKLVQISIKFSALTKRKSTC